MLSKASSGSKCGVRHGLLQKQDCVLEGKVPVRGLGRPAPLHPVIKAVVLSNMNETSLKLDPACNVSDAAVRTCTVFMGTLLK